MKHKPTPATPPRNDHPPKVSRAAAVVATSGLLLLAGCSTAPSFYDTCAGLGGSVMEDTAVRTVTGTVVGSNGGVGVGTGVVTITVRLCLTDSGEVLDMEVI